MTKNVHFLAEWHQLKSEHTHDRDKDNNYGCFNTETCRNCNYIYNARGCISCHNCDSVIECVQCVDCRDCAYCVGLNGARFHILNKEHTQEEYYAKLKAFGIQWDVQAFDPLDPYASLGSD